MSYEFCQSRGQVVTKARVASCDQNSFAFGFDLATNFFTYNLFQDQSKILFTSRVATNAAIVVPAKKNKTNAVHGQIDVMRKKLVTVVSRYAHTAA